MPVHTGGTSCVLCARSSSGELSSAQGSRGDAGPGAGRAACRGHPQHFAAVTQLRSRTARSGKGCLNLSLTPPVIAASSARALTLARIKHLDEWEGLVRGPLRFCRGGEGAWGGAGLQGAGGALLRPAWCRATSTVPWGSSVRIRARLPWNSPYYADTVGKTSCAACEAARRPAGVRGAAALQDGGRVGRVAASRRSLVPRWQRLIFQKLICRQTPGKPAENDNVH